MVEPLLDPGHRNVVLRLLQACFGGADVPLVRRCDLLGVLEPCLDNGKPFGCPSYEPARAAPTPGSGTINVPPSLPQVGLGGGDRVLSPVQGLEVRRRAVLGLGDS